MVVLLGWLIPVVALVSFNKCALGSWTGYDTTNESTGFTWKHFSDKWEFMLTQLHGTGLFFLMPIGIFGLALMFRWSWRMALVMTAWFLPGVLLYTSYYWGNELPGGTVDLNGVPVRRFDVDDYDLARHHDTVRAILNGDGRVSPEVEREYLRHSLHSAALLADGSLGG